jgi:hypothetical protein
MIVKELIDLLNKQDQELEVVLKYIDHTDYQYNLELRDKDIKVENLDFIDDDYFEEEYKCLIIELDLK